MPLRGEPDGKRDTLRRVIRYPGAQTAEARQGEPPGFEATLLWPMANRGLYAIKREEGALSDQCASAEAVAVVVAGASPRRPA